MNLGYNVKVKINLQQATKTQIGRTNIALNFHSPRRWMGWVEVDVMSQSLYPRKETRYHPFTRMGGSRGRCGTLRKISPPQGFDSRTVRPVPSRYTDWAVLELWHNVGQEHHFLSSSINSFDFQLNWFLYKWFPLFHLQETSSQKQDLFLLYFLMLSINLYWQLTS